MAGGGRREGGGCGAAGEGRERGERAGRRHGTEGFAGIDQGNLGGCGCLNLCCRVLHRYCGSIRKAVTTDWPVAADQQYCGDLVFG